MLCAQLLQLYPTHCDPRDCDPPGSFVHGILQASVLEWVAMLSSRGSSQPRDRTHIFCVSQHYRQILWYLQLIGSLVFSQVCPTEKGAVGRGNTNRKNLHGGGLLEKPKFRGVQIAKTHCQPNGHSILPSAAHSWGFLGPL